MWANLLPIDAKGAAIAIDRDKNHIAVWTELVRGAALDEWCVALDGKRVVNFRGPGARERAEQQRAELAALVTVLNDGHGDDHR